MEIRIKPTEKQYEAYNLLKEKDYVYMGGGAGSGKSWLICESRIINAIAFPGYKSFIARDQLTRLMASTYQTFIKVASHYGLSQGHDWTLNGQYHYIQFANGSRIDLIDVAYQPSDPMYERFGSLEFTDGALEECGEIRFEAFDILKTRVGRHKNDEFGLRASILLTGNPKKNWTYTMFYRPWKEGTLLDNFGMVQAGYRDNPYTQSVYEKALSTISDPVLRARMKDSVWEYDSSNGAMFDYEAIDDLFSNFLVPDNNKFMTVDVARFGSDKTVIYLWKGFVLYKKEEYIKQDTYKTSQRIKDIARIENIPYSRIVVDEDGVGGSVVDQCRGVHGFVNNSQPLPNENAKFEYLEKQNFTNLKTQCAFVMAEKTNRHEVAISIEDDKFKEDLTQELQVYRVKNPDNDTLKISLISKDDMKSELGRSPDYGDAFIMRGFFTLKREFRTFTEEEEFQFKRQELMDSMDFDPFSVV